MVITLKRITKSLNLTILFMIIILTTKCMKIVLIGIDYPILILLLKCKIINECFFRINIRLNIILIVLHL